MNYESHGNGNTTTSLRRHLALYVYSIKKEEKFLVRFKGTNSLYTEKKTKTKWNWVATEQRNELSSFIKNKN